MTMADVRTNFKRYFECDMMELQHLQENATDTTTLLKKAGIARGTVACEYLGAKFKEFISSTPPSVPILALVFFSEVHVPFVADPVRRAEVERFHKLPANSRRANYISSLENVDHVVGDIRRLLKHHGRAEDTLFIFTSDNGPETRRTGGAGSPGPLRGWKRTILEGGVRVPAVVEWPRRIHENVQVKQVTAHADFRATVADLLKQENPDLNITTGVDDGRKATRDVMDGVSLLPLFQSPDTWRRARELVICEYQISSDRRVCDKFAMYVDDLKFIATRGKELSPQGNQLFNLSADIGERKNIATTRDPKLYRSLAMRAKSLANDIVRSYTSRCRRPTTTHS